MSNIEVVNKGGRPKGNDTPSVLLIRELRNTIKAVASIREIIEESVTALRQQLATANATERIEILTQLTALASALTKNIETLAKYSMGPVNRRQSTDHDDTEPQVATRSVDIDKLLGASSK